MAFPLSSVSHRDVGRSISRAQVDECNQCRLFFRFAYVEFIRNVPLLLLVYLVFYGIPSIGGFAYDATAPASRRSRAA